MQLKSLRAARMSVDAHWMSAAIAEAKKAFGACHPNPAVGAVIVHQGECVARGYTQAPGGAHAEVEAIRRFEAAGMRAEEETTLYVTLEPCSTAGRTPPCTERVIQSGIRRVVAGATDPNPRHGGAGYAILRDAGLSVTSGVLEGECMELNLVFNNWMRKGCPLFAAKIATTLDGRIATRAGSSQWITGAEARADVALWRRRFPAIAVGAGTILQDDPRLTSRLEGQEAWCPRRLIFDRAGRCLAARGKRVFEDASADRSIYISQPEQLAQVPEAWIARGVRCWPWEGWQALQARCLEESITGIYFEGGTGLLSDLVRNAQLDYLFAYRAPKLVGDAEAPGPFSGLEILDINEAWVLRDVRHVVLGDDELMHGYVSRSR